MRFSAFLREFDLFLSLGKARAARLIKTAMTVRATYPLNIKRRRHVLRVQRIATRVAATVCAKHQPVADRNALIKDEALSLPQALLGRDGFEIAEDAAFKMIDLVNAFAAQERG